MVPTSSVLIPRATILAIFHASARSDYAMFTRLIFIILQVGMRSMVGRKIFHTLLCLLSPLGCGHLTFVVVSIPPRSQVPVRTPDTLVGIVIDISMRERRLCRCGGGVRHGSLPVEIIEFSRGRQARVGS